MLSLLLCLAGLVLASAGKPPLGYQPNLIFLLTDDQDTILGRDGYSKLGSLEIMPNVQQRLMHEGATFSNSFVATSICCPSRTESFTGRYFHNIGPPGDTHGECMFADTPLVAKPDTGLFGLIKNAGYNVGVFGKVTNDQTKILPLAAAQNTMSYIDAPIDYNNYNGLTYFRKHENTTQHSVETLDKKHPIFKTAYQTTQIGNRTLRWLDTVLKEDAPWFAYIGPHAPHYPAAPAPWYEKVFADVDAPITPNYNVSSPDKTQHIRQNPPLTELVKCWQNQHFRDRWRSLLSVDDLVRDVLAKVEAAGQLDKTFFVYTSDHGYKQGQWRVGTSKQHPFETDIRVPLLWRGPGIKGGSNLPDIVGNVDIAPTLLNLAGVDVPDFMDGKSLLAHLVTEEDVMPVEERARVKATWRDRFLTEYKSVGTYYNDHSSIWSDPDNSTEAFCGGPTPNSPHGKIKGCKEGTGVGDGNCYFVDSQHSNNWRSMRIINGTHNWQYVEYDRTWKYANTSSIQFFELYDVDSDPYQVHNLFKQQSPAIQASLHDELAKMWVCKGSKGHPSDCI